MPKAPQKTTIPPPARKGVFGQRGKAPPRVGLYARVSTHDQQTLPMQLSAMRSYARKRGWTVAVEVKDVGSGATTRPLREKLIETARRREIDYVIVWRLDRWGRSLVDLVNTLQELTALDVGFVSLSEALDLDHAERPRTRRHAGRICRIRTGHFAGPGEGGNRSSPKGWETARTAHDCR